MAFFVLIVGACLIPIIANTLYVRWKMGPVKRGLEAVQQGDAVAAIAHLEPVGAADSPLPRTNLGRTIHFSAAQLIGPALNQVGRFEDSLAYSQRATQLLDAGVKMPPAVCAAVQAEQMRSLTALDREPEARQCHQRILETLSDASSDDMDQVAEFVLPTYAVIGCDQKRAFSIQTLSELIDAFEPSFPSHPATMRCYLYRGNVLMMDGEYVSAEENLRHVLGDFTTPLHDATAADAWDAMANLRSILEEYPAASEAHGKCLNALKRTLGVDQLVYENRRLIQAVALLNHGQTKKAYELGKQAVDAMRRIAPAENPVVAQSQVQWAFMLLSFGEFKQAYEQSVAAEEYYAASKDINFTFWNFARIIRGFYFVDLGRRDEAIELLRQVVQQMKAELGQDNRQVIEIENCFASVLAANGLLDESREIIDRNQRIIEAYEPRSRIQESTLLRAKAIIALKSNDPTTASRLLDQAKQSIKDVLHPDNDTFASIAVWQAKTLKARGRYADARAELQTAERIWTETTNGEHPRLREVFELQASACQELGDRTAGDEYRTKAERIASIIASLP